jgi:AraC-like DNA-binding protein
VSWSARHYPLLQSTTGTALDTTSRVESSPASGVISGGSIAMIELASLLTNVVTLDRDIVLRFARECQAVAGRVADVSPQELVNLLRRFAHDVPNPSTAIGQAIVQLLVLDIARRASAAASSGRDDWDTDLEIQLGSQSPSASEMKGALERLAQRISRSQDRHDHVSLVTGPVQKVRSALNVVRRRYHEPGLRLAAVASHVLLTPSHLDRLLTRHTGRSFVHHLRGARLEAAQRALTCTTLSIKEVAGQTGYNSVTHLDRDFKKHIGCSPSEWRRQLSVSLDDEPQP